MKTKGQKERSDRFVAGDDAVVLHRSPGKKSVTGARERVTKRSRQLGLGTVRRERNMSQVEVAKRLGIDQGRVSRLEKRSDVKVSSLVDYLKSVDAENIELDITFNDGKHVTLPLSAEKRTDNK